MSQESLAEGVREMLERAKREKESLSTTELVLDGSNLIGFPGFPYKFEALAKKIIVSIDVFKSGYECKACKGKGKIKKLCSCEESGRPGYRYTEKELGALRQALSDEIVEARRDLPCPTCEGAFEEYREILDCSECKGHGALIELPDTSKNLPTTGVVVSIGNRVNRERLNFKIGDRILFGAYAGNMIPTKVGILFKILDANQAWCRIDGAEELGAFDFILQDEISS